MNPIGMMFALIAGVILLPALYMGVSNYADQVRATATALQMAHIQKAAEAYITTNAAAVEANSTASSPAVITVPMLVNTGFLPLGFNAMNPYGQTWEVQVLQPAANQLQALVLGIGGAAIPAKQSGMVATTAGDSGGVIGGGTGDFAVPGCAGGEACGAYAGWSVSTAGYQNVAAAHPAALIEYANNQLQSDYLYRVAVPGQPQLNTMQTNLNMGNNNINNANEINGQSETLAGGNPNGQNGSLKIGSNYFYGDSSNAAVRTPGGFYIQNQNASGPASIDEVNNVQASGVIGTSNPNGIYASMNPAATGNTPVIATNGIIDGNTFGGNGYAMYNGSWWANNAGDSSQSGNLYAGGQIHAGYDAWLGTANGTANAGWGCSDYGEIAASGSGNGQALMCNGSSWQAMGSMTGYNQVGFETIPGNGSSNFGIWEFCSITGHQGQGADELVPVAGPYVVGNHYAWDWDGGGSGTNNTPVTCWNNN